MGELIPFVCPCDRCRLRAIGDKCSRAVEAIGSASALAEKVFSAWRDAFLALPEAVRDRLRFPEPLDETETEGVN